MFHRATSAADNLQPCLPGQATSACRCDALPATLEILQGDDRNLSPTIYAICLPMPMAKLWDKMPIELSFRVTAPTSAPLVCILVVPTPMVLPLVLTVCHRTANLQLHVPLSQRRVCHRYPTAASTSRRMAVVRAAARIAWAQRQSCAQPHRVRRLMGRQRCSMLARLTAWGTANSSECSRLASPSVPQKPPNADLAVMTVEATSAQAKRKTSSTGPRWSSYRTFCRRRICIHRMIGQWSWCLCCMGAKVVL